METADFILAYIIKTRLPKKVKLINCAISGKI